MLLFLFFTAWGLCTIVLVSQTLITGPCWASYICMRHLFSACTKHDDDQLLLVGCKYKPIFSCCCNTELAEVLASSFTLVAALRVQLLVRTSANSMLQQQEKVGLYLSSSKAACVAG